MKILIDARLYGLENAGLGRYATNLVEQLAKLDKVNQYGILLRDKYFNQLNLPDNWTKISAEYKHYSLLEQTTLPGIIKSFKPDLTHFLHFNVPLFFSGKFVVTLHDILMHQQKGLEASTLPFYKYYLKRLGYKSVFRHAVVSSLKIIVPSQAVKDELIAYYKINKDKIAVTYEGFDEKISFSGEVKPILNKYRLAKPYYIYTGNAYPHKNLKRAIEATLALNKKTKTKVTFAIASSRNIFVQKLEKLVGKLGASAEVKLLGFVPDKELGILYKNAVAFIFPSLSEGFGLPGLEALACGTLAVVSDIPVFREIYKDQAIYFDPKSVSSIEKTMKKALDIKEAERVKKIKESQLFVKRYSWVTMAKETLGIYEKVAD